MRAGLLSLCQGKGTRILHLPWARPNTVHGCAVAAAEGGCQQPLSTSQLSSALPHQPRKLQKGWAGAKNPALLDLARKVALSCHRSCLSSTQWPPWTPSHRWESHRQAAWTATALTAQEPPGTSVTLGCFCLQTACCCRGRGTNGAPAVQHLVLHQSQNSIPQGHKRSQSPGHSV